MAIYKRDVTTVNGQVVSGERVDGKTEIRMPYRIAASITSEGMTYLFSHMDGNEAVYKRGDKPAEHVAAKPPKQAMSTDTHDNILTELPHGAILDSEFVGRYKSVNGQRYRLYQPISKMDGKFVYVPA